jgi:hypothetical protein
VLQLAIQDADGTKWNLPGERWELEHILLPMHAKVRLSFGELWRIVTVHLVAAANATRTAISKRLGGPDIQFRVSVLRTQDYIEDLLMAGHSVHKNVVWEITRTVAFSRYIGVVRLSVPPMGTVDVVVDTTSTQNNPIFLLVIPLDDANECREIARRLSAKLIRPDDRPE